MPTRDMDSQAEVLVSLSGTTGSSHAERPEKLTISTKASKTKNIRVSPAVFEAAGKDGEELLRSLGTTLEGLTQMEAEERTYGRSQ